MATTKNRIVYETMEDGQWFPLLRGGEEIACCSCGLVHLVKFSVRKGRKGVRYYRLGPQTGGIRKALGVRVTKVRKPATMK